MRHLLFIIFIFFFISLTNSYSQTKYLIYFNSKDTSLSKLSYEKLGFSSESIERRAKSGFNSISFEDLPIKNNYIEKLLSLNINIIHQLNWFNAVSAYLTDNQKTLLKDFYFISKIEKVRSYKRRKIAVENNLKSKAKIDLQTELDYGLSITQNQLCDVPYLHSEKNLSGAGVTIGILDSGFGWKKHKALKDRKVLAEWDFINNDSSTANAPGENIAQEDHGTFVFSVIAGYDEGVLIGPAYNSNFLLAKTEYLDTETIVEEDNFAAAMEWMDKMGADIVTSSLGYSTFDNPDDSYTYENMDGKTAICTRAYNLAFERGILCISSAGNEGNNSWKYITAPADGFNTIAVGAVDKNNKVTSFSSFGPTFDGRVKPDVVALGSEVYGANARNGSYHFGSGTSFSAPMVAGVAALLSEYYSNYSNIMLREVILESGDRVDSPNYRVGYGLVSGKRAIDSIKTAPKSFKQHPSYPNPFSKHTIFSFDSPYETVAEFRVFNLLGQKVYTDNSINVVKGRNLIKWYGLSDNSSKCSSGVYMLTVIINGELYADKVIYLK